MFDFSQLDQLARPVSGVVIGPRPLQLEGVFDYVARNDWHPRTLAFEPELSRLEASYTRGTCIAPLVTEGDVVFIDPHMPAQSGDLVSFRLSARGAAAQNSALPEGQSPCKPGDNWLKLLTRYHGFDMLLDRYGSSATATLLCCEHPDDTPQLRPVRNIMRRGRLLYPSDASGIGTNAVTTVSETSVSSHTLTTSITAILSQTVGPFPAAATVVITLSGYITAQNTSPTVLVSPEMAYAINTTSGSLPAGHPFFDIYSVPTSTTVGQNFTYEQSFSLAANTSQTYYFNASVINTTNNVLTIAAMVMKTEAIYK